MDVEYSTYEAKARFSELLRTVREGGRVVVTYRGEKVALVVPYEEAAEAEETFPERLARMRREGSLCGPTGPRSPDAFKPGAHVPGALKRFLDFRD